MASNYENILTMRNVEKILLMVPMPPTSNKSYWAKSVRTQTGYFAKMVKSNELRGYQQTMQQWAQVNSMGLHKNRRLITDWINKGFMIRLDSYVCFNKEKIWTLKNMPKKNDLKNRLKALHDCVSDIMGIDDKLFFAGYDEKCVTEKEEGVLIVFSPHAPRNIAEVPIEDL